ncbi:M24 family metallopeptidase [Shewanella sp. GXUN23E]|uniref:M24 family metallopeptidase n=1 Tax=Shewanella sp. GXUN23E TaxID=3422498 RepID=UPI003D7CC056
MNTQLQPVLEKRQAALRAGMAARGLDSLLLFGYENIRYISGFSGHAAYLVLSQQDAFLISDYRYAERAKAESVGVEVICRDRDNESLGHCINRFLTPQTKVGFEAAHMDVATWQAIAAELAGKFTSDQLKPVTGMVERMRMVKDEWEVAQIRAAAAIADEALAQTLPLFKAGVSERDLALELEYRMQKLGSEGMSFDTILLFAQRSSMPHGSPSAQTLKSGDFITLDFGAVVNGYRSDMTRSYLYGEASDKQIAIYNTVAEAQQAAMDTVKAGVPAIEALNASNRILQASPFAEFVGEGLGHGVGLFLHEQPFIKPGCDHVLQAGNIITIEPGIYIPGYGGVRLEEDILVTDTGYELLTRAPKPMILEP